MVLHEDKIGQTLLIPTNLLDLISEDHPCFFVKNLVDEIDFDEIHEDFIGNAGMKAYSRRMLTRLVIMASIDGIRSSRKIAKLTEENVVFMYLCGGDSPSYRTIINFRNEYGYLLENVLALTIGVAKNAGMVNLNEIGFDGTIIKANSSSSSVINENDLKLAREIINEGKKADIMEDEKYGDKRGDKVLKDLTLKEKIKKLVKKSINEEEIFDDEKIHFNHKEVDKIDKALDEVEKIKKSESDEKEDKEISVSLTEPEARWMKNKKGKVEQSFNVQNTVDLKEGIILRTEVVQDQTDHYQLKPQIESLKEFLNEDLKDSKILADNGFNTGESIQYLYENDLNGYIPSRSQASKDKKNMKPFSKAQFQYNMDKNHYICPNNKILPYQNTYKDKKKEKKVYYTNECKNCQYKDQCTPKSNYRIITHYSTDYQDLMHQKMEQKENKEIYKRRIIVERPFADMKHNQNFNQTTVRGTEKIQNELNLIAVTHNIKRIHNNLTNITHYNSENIEMASIY
jgi:transposase